MSPPDTGGRARARIVLAILRKDFAHLVRDRFSLALTLLGVVAYVAIFWLLPTDAEPTLRIGIYHRGLDTVMREVLAEPRPGVELIEFPTALALQAAVEEPGDERSLLAGIEFQDRFLEAVARGEPTRVRVHLASGVPPEQRGFLGAEVRELAYRAAGNPPPVAAPDRESIVLGHDAQSRAIDLRDRVRPVLACLVLLFEIFALGLLVSAELRSRAIAAILVTPARLSDVVLAKGLFGATIAFVQVMILLGIIGGLGTRPGVVIPTLALGALLVSGCGVYAGCRGRDLTGVVAWGLLFVVPLAVPAATALLPGTASVWIRALPSWPFVEVLFQVFAFDRPTSELLAPLAMLLLWGIAFLCAGLFALQSRIRAW